jgi:outer membrane murein-binding lipoprotein Lpp
MRAIKLVQLVVVAALLTTCGTVGCSKAPNKDEQSKLDEAKSSAESAEKKLYDTKQERMRLEAEVQKKKGEEK